MADENMENMITEVDLDDETVALILQDEEEEKHGNEDAEPQVNDYEDIEHVEDAACDDAAQEEAKTEEPMQDERADGTEVKDDNINSKETKPEYGPRLFVGGLSFKTEDEDFRQHFEKYGELKECFIVEKKKINNSSETKGRGRTKGYGFVTMSTVEETEVVLKDTHVINDKVVQVMVSTPKDAPERRLRISLFKLDKEKTTKESLMAHFSQFGNVKQCFVNMEQVDGKTVPHGTGFIVMASEEELKTVLNVNIQGHQMIDGKSVQVKWVVSDGKNHYMLRRLWFGGLDREKTTEADLQEHFSPFGTVKECVIVRDPPTTEGGECRSKGYGFIIMDNIRETGAILKRPEEHRIHGKVLVFNRTPKNQNKPNVVKEKAMKKNNNARVNNKPKHSTSPMPSRNSRGKGSMRGGNDKRKVSASRNDVLYGSNDGYYQGPRQGGSFQYEGDYYGEDASSYGPMRAPMSRGPGGGWVFVDDLYGQPSTDQRQMKGFRGKQQQHSSLDLGGGYSGGFEGDYSSNYGKGNNTNRNKRRGRGRPY